MQACACRKVAETSRRKCPHCEYVEPTAVPFSRSGAEYTVCRVHDKPVPVLTELSKQHFVDERGYTCCAACGYVLDDFTGELPTRYEAPRYYSDWYATLAYQRGGSMPAIHGAKGRRVVDLTLGNGAGRAIARDAAVMRDAEALCSMLEIRGDVKAAVLHAVASFYGTVPRKGVRIESALIAITERVCLGFGFDVPCAKAVKAFNVSNDQITHARNSVGRWFETYWKGDKRQ